MALVDRGVARGERIAVMSQSREEWAVADFGVLAAGAVTVPIYPTATSEQVAFILANSGAVLAVLEGRAQLDAVRGALDAAPAVREIAILDGTETLAPLKRAGAADVTMTSYAELVRRGRARIESEDGATALRLRRAAREPEDLATIVYTSGTTGPPRGVALSHRALLAETRALLEAFSIEPDDEQLLLLPLAHILAKIRVRLAPFVRGGPARSRPGSPRGRADVFCDRPSLAREGVRSRERVGSRRGTREGRTLLVSNGSSCCRGPSRKNWAS
jgi:long-chain acyl-CoA synthetase